MAFLGIVANYFEAKKLKRMTRAQVLFLREERLRETLINTFDNSPFYRELWLKAGIARKDLATVAISKLPVVDKKMLMSNFQRVVSDPSITKKEVEDFVVGDPSGSKFLRRKYLVINTSGSSGYIGLFLFTNAFIDRLVASLLIRVLPHLGKYFTRRTKFAFIGEVSGHHAGFNLVQALPALLFQTLSLPVEALTEKQINKLMEFRPYIIAGYPSGLARLAQLKLDNQLSIAPEMILSSGEPLTVERKEIIEKAFGISAIDFYAASECLALGIDTKGSGALDIFDELFYIEVLDEKGSPASPGDLGRVVITVFGNSVEPLVRYALDDEIVLLPESDYPFTRATPVSGRKLECLTFQLEKGELKVHPMEFVGMFFPGLRQYQIVQSGPRSAIFRVVADGNPKNIKERIMAMYPEFLSELDLRPGDVDLEIEIVESIAADPKTGKTPIIIPLEKYLEIKRQKQKSFGI